MVYNQGTGFGFGCMIQEIYWVKFTINPTLDSKFHTIHVSFGSNVNASAGLPCL